MYVIFDHHLQAERRMRAVDDSWRTGRAEWKDVLARSASANVREQGIKVLHAL
jgi:hypothetical protein